MKKLIPMPLNKKWKTAKGPKTQKNEKLTCMRTAGKEKKTHIVNKSFPYTFIAKGKPSWPFNKWEWRLLKLPSEPDQAKKKKKNCTVNKYKRT